MKKTTVYRNRVSGFTGFGADLFRGGETRRRLEDPNQVTPMRQSIISAGRALALIGVVAAAACWEDKISAPEQPAQATLGSCTNLQVPSSATLALHTYATGVQIYRWNDTTWSLVSPSAVLTTDAAGASSLGVHYAGPTWQAVSGSKVTGAVAERCTPSANAIPWLLLNATASVDAGVFQGVKYIQRVNTTGGLAPGAPGKTIGEITSVSYTAEYFFYR
jgi:hypothetical protein